jgi:hypothetical protein
MGLPGGNGFYRAQKKCPGFTVRFSDPSACGRSLCGQMSGISRSPLAITAFQHATGHCTKSSAPRVLIGQTPCRSRKLDTAFRSLTTTLSPPLRGQRSWPAPSFPHRKSSRIRSTSGSFAPFGFEAESGRCQRPKPVIRANIQRSRFIPGLHSLSGPLAKTLRIKAFNRLHFRKPVLPNVRLLLAPRHFLFRFRYRSTLKTRFVRLDLSFRRSLLGLRAHRQPDKSVQRLGTLSCLQQRLLFSSTSA